MPLPRPSREEDAPAAPRVRAPGGVGRACLGLGLMGQGLAISSGVVPHEDWLVAVGLLAFGIVLAWTGTLPRFAWLRPSHVLAIGIGMLAVVGVAWALTGHAPTGPFLLLAILGSATILAGLFHKKILHFRGHNHSLRDLAPCIAVAGGVPLLVWLVQASFKHLTGTTPVETFLVVFLVLPAHAILGGLGVPSTSVGQTITLAGPGGPMPVDIGVACSGIQAMALFLGILALFAATQRPSGGRLLAWTAVGLAGVYVANLLRLVVVLLAGHWWGANALEVVHANAGWVFFVAWSLLFALWVRRGLDKHPRPAQV